MSLALDELGAEAVEDIFYFMDAVWLYLDVIKMDWSPEEMQKFLTCCDLTICDKNRSSYINPVEVLDTAIKFAEKHQRMSCLEALIACGGVLTRSAFLAAFDLGDLHLCELLIRINCASSYLYNHVISSTGQSILHRACREGRLSTVVSIAKVWITGLFNFRRNMDDFTPLQIICLSDQQQTYRDIKCLNSEFFRDNISRLFVDDDAIVIRKLVEWDYEYIEAYTHVPNGFLHIFPATMEVGQAPMCSAYSNATSYSCNLALVADFDIDLSEKELSTVVRSICGHGIILSDKMILFRQFLEQGFNQSEFEKRFMDTALLPVVGNESRMLLYEMGLLG